MIDYLNLSETTKTEIQGYSVAKVIFQDKNSVSENETILRIGDADGVLGSWNSIITKRILDLCLNIKYIGICGTSITNIDVDEIKRRGIVLKNVVDYGDEATAEFIFAQLLILFRGFGKYQWDSVMPAELNGKSIGIVGLGAVGRQIARLALGFNMKVSYFSRTRRPEWEAKGLIFKDLDDLLSSCDIITIHVPRNTMVLGKHEFELIKEGSILVNTAIGTVFDLDSFISWIKKGTNFFIIDDQIYIDQIRNLPNVIALSITGGKTKESIERLVKKIIENIKTSLVDIL